jgi:large subunit ribosomal protein L18
MPSPKEITQNRRKARIRAKISGTADRPRLTVFRSLKAIYAQVVDDTTGKILASASDLKSKEKGTKVEKAKNVGLEIAKKAKDLKIETVVFDRNKYKYHGRVAAVAEGAREGGLKF